MIYQIDFKFCVVWAIKIYAWKKLSNPSSWAESLQYFRQIILGTWLMTFSIIAIWNITTDFMIEWEMT